MIDRKAAYRSRLKSAASLIQSFSDPNFQPSGAPINPLYAWTQTVRCCISLLDREAFYTLFRIIAVYAVFRIAGFYTEFRILTEYTKKRIFRFEVKS